MCYPSKDGLKEREADTRGCKERPQEDREGDGLYMINELIGKGLPVWLPYGEVLKSEIENFAIETEEAYGYDRVTTRFLGRRSFSRHPAICRTTRRGCTRQ